MEYKDKTYAKLLLAGALAFSFAAEATNYNLQPATESISVTAPNDQDWHKKLLGPYSNVDTLTAANMREAYITLLENVRQLHGRWADKDWEQAKAVLDKLDYKKNTLESQLSIGDKAKIKMLQAEFRTLETTDDVKD